MRVLFFAFLNIGDSQQPCEVISSNKMEKFKSETLS